MATIRKRTLPSGKTCWQADYVDGGGKRRHRQFTTKKEADSFLVHARGEVSRGIHTAESASITLADAGERWLAKCAEVGLEQMTVERYRSTFEHHVKPKLGKTKLSKIGAPMIQSAVDEVAAILSRSSARKALSCITSVFAQAMRDGRASHNPAREVKLPHARRSGPHIEMPTKAELAAILKHTPARWKPFIRTAMLTGMRSSELRGLLWSDVNLDAGMIHVRRRVDRKGSFGPPKSKAGTRDIPLSQTSVTGLKAWKLQCPNGALGLVFPNASGRIEEHTNILNRVFWPAQIKAGVTVMRDALGDDGNPIQVPDAKFSLHALRHTAAALFIEQGFPPKKVQALMGHSSIQMTFDLYGYLFPSDDDDRNAMAQIEARLLSE
ncbi:site-specific integrase [Ancylobacter aquaticus]|nr:site-specific integrase [Ancylobacter aquaticus]